MIKNEQQQPNRSVRRVNLSLPVVKTNSYEIYYTLPPIQSRQPSGIRPVTRQKPLIDLNNIKLTNTQTTTNRLPARYRNLNGPILVNFLVDMPTPQLDSSTGVADTISNALINSGYSAYTFRCLPAIIKCNKYRGIKDGSEQSGTASDDKMIHDSLNSFEDPFINRTKNGMWHNIHHPHLTTIKALHTRKKLPNIADSNDIQSRAPYTSSLGTISQESLLTSNERIYEKVEQLTKHYFPTIQQLRHSHPSPEFINNRMHLHRDEKRDYIPTFFRPHITR